jgi:hypothetical protein
MKQYRSLSWSSSYNEIHWSACLRGKTCTVYELFIQAGQINYCVMNYDNSLFEWFKDSVWGLIILRCVLKERHVK